MKKDLEYYMSLKYPVKVEQYEGDGDQFYMTIPDLPGVWSKGGTVEEAYADLVEGKRVLFEAYLDKGMLVPEPAKKYHFSLPPEKNKNLFSMNVCVRDNSAVMVSESPDGGLRIEGYTLEKEEKMILKGIFLSRKAAMALCDILNEWKALNAPHI